MPCPISDRRRVPPPIRQQLVDEFTRRPGHVVLLSQGGGERRRDRHPRPPQPSSTGRQWGDRQRATARPGSAGTSSTTERTCPTPARLRALACGAGVVAVVMTAVEHRGHGGPTEIDNLVMPCIPAGSTPAEHLAARRSHTSWHDSARPRQRLARSARVPGSDDGEPAADRGAASISRRLVGRIP